MIKQGSPLPRLVKWIFLTGIIFLVFMTVLRLVFFFHFSPPNYEFSSCFQAFILGFRFDMRIVCGIILFPFVIGNLKLTRRNGRLTPGSWIQMVVMAVVMVLLILFMKKGHASLPILTGTAIVFALIGMWLLIKGNCNPFENSFSARIFIAYFGLLSVLLVLFYAVDFEHFDYLHERLNAGAMNYLGDARISLNMVWETYPVITLLILVILCTGVMIFLIYRSFKKISPSIYKGGLASRWIIGIVFFLMLGLGVFGRLNQYPLRWSDAFAFDDNFKANLSLNPVQSFLSTLKFRASGYDLKKVKDYYPLMSRYLHVDHPDSSLLNYDRTYAGAVTTTPPNVVVVICESFSAYKSSMWGNPLNTTPYFSEMCNQGIFFDRCFTPAYGTARGVWAVLTGIPDVEYPNTSSRNPAYVSQHSIINDFNGYEKYYFIGGSSSWANIRGLFTNNLDSLHLYEDKDYHSKSIDVWGISDKRLFLEANEVLKKQSRPFIAVIQTADNHRPYTIPDEDKKEFDVKSYPEDTLHKYGFGSNAELNAFRFTDFSFRKFIEAARKEAYFPNTIFVFVGDHGIRGNAGDQFPAAWEADGLTTQHVPLLFYAPDLLKPQRINKTCSQLDLLPSVSALAGLPFTNTALGKNLFDTSDYQVRFPNSAFIFDPNLKQIGFVTDQYCYVHNLLSGRQDFRSSKDNTPLVLNDSTAADRKELQELSDAYYQTAKYLLTHNKKRIRVKTNP